MAYMYSIFFRFVFSCEKNKEKQKKLPLFLLFLLVLHYSTNLVKIHGLSGRLTIMEFREGGGRERGRGSGSRSGEGAAREGGGKEPGSVFRRLKKFRVSF